MAHGGKAENAGVKRLSSLALLLSALAFLSGCETLNDALVRQSLKDRGLSHRLDFQIREGLEKRMAAPPVNAPRRPAPAFLDQG
jgi:hypothetical protein